MASWTWTNVYNSIGYGVRCFASDNGGRYIIAGTTNGIAYSSDFGDTWSQPLSENVAGTVVAVASSATGSLMYALTNTSLYKSVNNGETWSVTGTLLPSGSGFTGICCNDQGQNVVVCSDKAAGGSGNLLFCLNPQNPGGTWDTATIDIGGNTISIEANFTSVACMPAGTNRYYVAVARYSSSSSG